MLFRDFFNSNPNNINDLAKEISKVVNDTHSIKTYIEFHGFRPRKGDYKPI
jgi:hypothetical protein